MLIKMRKGVIFVTGSLSDGGAEKVISILASGCAKLGADVTLVVLREKEYTYKVSSQVKLIQLKTKEGKIKEIDRIKQLHSILKESDATAVIPFLTPVTVYTMIANIGVGKKVIVSERADPYVPIKALNLDKKSSIALFLMRKMQMYGLADWMVFQTPDAKAYYNDRIQHKCTIIPNPLDVETLPFRYSGEREHRIVAAGRFSEEKNFPLLLDAFAEFHKSHPDYTMTIYGKGKLRDEYLQQIDLLGISSCVDLPGYSDHLQEEIYRAAIYVSTSNHEGISNSMLEALGMGIPTIVTDCPVGGARMFVRNGENGVIIPMNDREALVKAMCKIADNTAFSEEISRNAEKIRTEVSDDAICKKWLELI